MAVCRAACLRPFVSLREFRGPTLCRQSARRLLPCRALTTAAAAATTAAAASGGSSVPKYAAMPAEQQRQVDAFLDILLDWNTRMNLTGGLACCAPVAQGAADHSYLCTLVATENRAGGSAGRQAGPALLSTPS